MATLEELREMDNEEYIAYLKEKEIAKLLLWQIPLGLSNRPLATWM